MDPQRTPRPRHEAPSLEAMMRRMLRSLVRRAGEGDLFSLEALANLAAASDQALVDGALAAHKGPAAYSWSEIAAELGMSRQGARQRFGGGD